MAEKAEWNPMDRNPKHYSTLGEPLASGIGTERSTTCPVFTEGCPLDALLARLDLSGTDSQGKMRAECEEGRIWQGSLVYEFQLYHLTRR